MKLLIPGFLARNCFSGDVYALTHRKTAANSVAIKSGFNYRIVVENCNQMTGMLRSYRDCCYGIKYIKR